MAFFPKVLQIAAVFVCDNLKGALSVVYSIVFLEFAVIC